jgi:hypothetical protein
MIMNIIVRQRFLRAMFGVALALASRTRLPAAMKMLRIAQVRAAIFPKSDIGRDSCGSGSARRESGECKAGEEHYSETGNLGKGKLVCSVVHLSQMLIINIASLISLKTSNRLSTSLSILEQSPRQHKGTECRLGDAIGNGIVSLLPEVFQHG